VYEAAKRHNAETKATDTRPINAVVRHSGGRWLLESGLNSAEGCNFECDLDAFDDYFYESYQDEEFSPDSDDEVDFINSFGGLDSEDDDRDEDELEGCLVAAAAEVYEDEEE
jgi:hypothetical protein